MRRMIRAGFAMLFVVLLVGRAVEIPHLHDESDSHPESCVVCRALQAPAATPVREIEFAPLVLPDHHDAHGEPSAIVADSPILGAHQLRAPPLA